MHGVSGKLRQKKITLIRPGSTRLLGLIINSVMTATSLPSKQQKASAPQIHGRSIVVFLPNKERRICAADAHTHSNAAFKNKIGWDQAKSYQSTGEGGLPCPALLA